MSSENELSPTESQPRKGGFLEPFYPWPEEPWFWGRGVAWAMWPSVRRRIAGALALAMMSDEAAQAVEDPAALLEGF